MPGFNDFRRIRASLATTVAVAMFATNVSAVTLSNVQGSVYVNKGDGFQAVSNGTALSSGDRVRVSAGGSANIVYENGCATFVGAGKVAVVQSSAPSCGGANLTTDSVGDAAGSSSLAAAAPTSVGIGTETILIGGLVVGGAVGLAVAVSNSNNDDKPPVSP